jgi:hypothetical protein
VFCLSGGTNLVYTRFNGLSSARKHRKKSGAFSFMIFSASNSRTDKYRSQVVGVALRIECVELDEFGNHSPTMLPIEFQHEFSDSVMSALIAR